MLKTLYLLDPSVGLSLDGNALRVTRPEKADTLIPLRRVERAVVRVQNNDLLKACLAIIQRGGMVHLQNAMGDLCAVIQQPMKDGTEWARELAAQIAHHPGLQPFRDWRNNQERHAWSLVFRKNYTADFETNRKRIFRYLEFFRPEVDVDAEIKSLDEQLVAWTESQIALQGLQPISDALQQKGAQLITPLLPCLELPLVWAWARWRRMKFNSIAADNIAFFELHAASSLRSQLERHINALNAAYGNTWYGGKPQRSNSRRTGRLP